MTIVSRIFVMIVCVSLLGNSTFAQQAAYQPAPQNPYYFGLNVQLVHDFNGPGLRVVSVTPGGPACRAGLEQGDIISTINGFGFAAAQNSFDAVRLMNSYVGGNSGIAPAASTLVAPPSPAHLANMVVRDIRTGRYVNVSCYPTLRFGGGGGGIAPAAEAAAGAKGGK